MKVKNPTLEQVQTRLDNGMTQREIAKEFDVSEATISRRVAELNEHDEQEAERENSLDEQTNRNGLVDNSPDEFNFRKPEYDKPLWKERVE